MCVQHGVDLPVGSAEHAFIWIGDVVIPTERVVRESAGVINAPLGLNPLRFLLQGFTINLNKERSALTNTHAYIIQMVTHTQASYKWSHTRRHHTNGHTHTQASYKWSHTHTHHTNSHTQTHTHGHTHIQTHAHSHTRHTHCQVVGVFCSLCYSPT